MKHHHMLSLVKAFSTFVKERNSPKEAEALKAILDTVQDYVSNSTSQPAENKADD
mgnify:CR=1 FL=1